MKILFGSALALLFGVGNVWAGPLTTVNGSDCGELTSLSLANGKVTLTTNSSACASANTGTFSVPDKIINAMDEFSSQTITTTTGATGSQGTVTLKQVLTSKLGLTPTQSGNNVTYTAPSVGPTGSSDWFYFLLEDSKTPYPNVAVGKVLVNKINDVTVSGGGGGGSSTCVESSTLICKGIVDWMGNSGKKLDQRFAAIGEIHAWQVNLINSSRVTFSVVDSDVVKISISKNAGDMTTSLSGICTVAETIETSLTIVDASVGHTYQCNVPVSSNAATVFLNIQMLREGGNGVYNEYDLTWVDQS